MGYQESMIRVSSLAEAAGIRRALKEKVPPQLFAYFATERVLTDLRLGDPLDLSTDFDDCLVVPAGTLFVMAGGERRPYQMRVGRWHYLDDVRGLTMANYYQHFQPLDEGRVEAAWEEDLEAAQREYDAWCAYLDYCRVSDWAHGAWWRDQVAFGSQATREGLPSTYLDLVV